MTIDIDILLIKLSKENNSLSKKPTFKSVFDWIVMADRYPFKAHEEAGVKELILTKL